MLAMRLAFDHIVASAVRPSIAAAMGIAASVTGNCLQFSALADLRREMSTKSNNNAVTAGHARPFWGRDVGVGQPVFAAGADGAGLFQRLCAAETAADRRRRNRTAVRARAAAAFGSVPAAQIPGDHSAI